MPTVLTCDHCSFNYFCKILPFYIIKQVHWLFLMSSDWLFLLDSEWSIPPGSNSQTFVTRLGIRKARKTFPDQAVH